MTRATVQQFFSRLGAGDVGGVVDLFAESVDWDVPGPAALPWLGRRSSRAEVAEFFQILGASLAAEDFVVGKILVDGDDAVVLGETRQRVIATGKSFHTPFAAHFTVSDGKITGYRFFEDSYAVAEAAGI